MIIAVFESFLLQLTSLVPHPIHLCALCLNFQNSILPKFRLQHPNVTPSSQNSDSNTPMSPHPPQTQNLTPQCQPILPKLRLQHPNGTSSSLNSDCNTPISPHPPQTKIPMSPHLPQIQTPTPQCHPILPKFRLHHPNVTPFSPKFRLQHPNVTPSSPNSNSDTPMSPHLPSVIFQGVKNVVIGKLSTPL